MAARRLGKSGCHQGGARWNGTPLEVRAAPSWECVLSRRVVPQIPSIPQCSGDSTEGRPSQRFPCTQAAPGQSLPHLIEGLDHGARRARFASAVLRRTSRKTRHSGSARAEARLRSRPRSTSTGMTLPSASSRAPVSASAIRAQTTTLPSGSASRSARNTSSTGLPQPKRRTRGGPSLARDPRRATGGR